MVHALGLPPRVRSFSVWVGTGAQATTADATAAADGDEGWGGEAAYMDDDDFDDDMLAQDAWVRPGAPRHSPHCRLRPTLTPILTYTAQPLHLHAPLLRCPTLLFPGADLYHRLIMLCILLAGVIEKLPGCVRNMCYCNSI